VRAVAGASFYAPVEGELRELERRLGDVGRGAHPVFQAAVAHLFQTPGKLLRPTLVFLSARFGAGSDGEVGEVTAARALPSEQRYLERIELKTASLYAACCQGAALLADAEPEHVAALGAFGTNLGLAFQITDDVLDLVGDEEDLGKTVGRDLLEGMPTLPMIYAVAERDGSGDLAARILAPVKSEVDVRRLLGEIRRTSGPERARRRALEFHDAALGALERLPAGAERESLREVADFVVSRVR
jgi:heptaprenyl diphosphate synthase component 2